MTEEEKLALIREHIRAGRVGTFDNLKHWIYKNMPNMKLATWQELRSMLKETYRLTDSQLAMSFAAERGEQNDDDFTPLVESLEISGFVKRGMDFTSGMEAPNAFGFWSFATVLGAALRRNVYVDMGYFKIWPAMQSLLVGPSQVGKSTISDYIVGLATESGVFNRLMEAGSPEALLGELADLSSSEGEASGLIFVSDLGTFLGKRDYNKEMVDRVLEIFDARDYSKRKTYTHGYQEFKNVAVSALWCANERVMRESITQDNIESGLLARLLVIFQGGTDKRVPIPKLANPGEREWLISFLRKASMVRGVARLTPEAERYYIDRYNQLKDFWPEDEFMHPFWGKYPTHMLKLALLLSVSDNPAQRGDIEISEQHIMQADSLIDWIAQKLPRLYRILGTTQFGDDSVAVMNYIKEKGGKVSSAALGRAMVRRMDRMRLRAILETFKEYRMVIEKPSNELGGGTDIILISQEGV